MPLLLDTNILVQLARKSTEKIISIVNPRKENVFISVVSIAEIRSLAVQNRWGTKKIDAMNHFLSQSVAIDINYEPLITNYVAIDCYSQAKHPVLQLPGTSRNMGKNDLWIAATAATFELALVTSDNDFDHLHPVFIKVQKIPFSAFIGL